MITKDQLLMDVRVREEIRNCGRLFKRINFEDPILLFKNISVVDGFRTEIKLGIGDSMVEVLENRLFVDWEKYEYLYELRLLDKERNISECALILLDKDGKVITGNEQAQDDVWGYGKWNLVEGCKFCCETNAVLSSTVRNNDMTIYSDIRMDCRPEDELWQIDNEITYHVGFDTDSMYSEWSNSAIDLNYCPICGRQLRKEPIPFRGINQDLNHNANQQEFYKDIDDKVSMMRYGYAMNVGTINKEDYVPEKKETLTETDANYIEALLNSKEDRAIRMFRKIDLILMNIYILPENEINKVLSHIDTIINNSTKFNNTDSENYLDYIMRNILNGGIM